MVEIDWATFFEDWDAAEFVEAAISYLELPEAPSENKSTIREMVFAVLTTSLIESTLAVVES